jgi:hypothetical protein
LEEQWVFRAQGDGPSGSLVGTLHKSWSGLAEYDVRSSVRGLTPRQRDFILQTVLARQLPGADFTQLNLSPADDLSTPLQMDAKVSVAKVPLPTLLTGFDINACFAAPERNRPLLINNGQKMHLVQTLDLTSAHDKLTDAMDPPPFDQQIAGIHATVSWTQKGTNAWRRTAELDIDQPLVAQADYVAVRRMLRDWTDHLSR